MLDKFLFANIDEISPILKYHLMCNITFTEEFLRGNFLSLLVKHMPMYNYSSSAYHQRWEKLESWKYLKLNLSCRERRAKRYSKLCGLCENKIIIMQKYFKFSRFILLAGISLEITSKNILVVSNFKLRDLFP